MSSDLIAAVYMFAARNHRGRDIRMHRLLCVAGLAYRRKTGTDLHLSCCERLIDGLNPPNSVQDIYGRLVENYGGRQTCKAA